MGEPISTLLITGLTGAGKTASLHALELLGFQGCDGLPPRLLPSWLPMPVTARRAVVLDLRLQDFAADALEILPWLQEQRLPLLFLEASDAVLVQRLTAHRRRHPFIQSGGPLEAIWRERSLLQPLRRSSTHRLDTSELSLLQLRQRLDLLIGGNPLSLTVSLVSFGFKYGVPLDANLVFDVRFLTNPFFDPKLRPLTGQDPQLQRFLFEQPQTQTTYERLLQLIRDLLPAYSAEPRAQLTIAIGCTGGQHRSVALIERLAQALAQESLPLDLQVVHRHLALSQQEIAARFPEGIRGAPHG